MTAVWQVQVLAEFGDLPQNVDLIVLQQLPVSTELNYLEVPIASHALNRIHFAVSAFPHVFCEQENHSKVRLGLRALCPYRITHAIPKLLLPSTPPLLLKYM